MKSKIIQIQTASVPNVLETQCYVFLYALCEDGSLWFRRDNDKDWTEQNRAPSPNSRIAEIADAMERDKLLQYEMDRKYMGDTLAKYIRQLRDAI